MQALSISMVMLGVSDLDVSIAFYRDKLGYSVANRSQEFGFLSAGTVSLILSRPIGAAIQPIARAVEPILSVPAVVTVYRELRRKCHKDRLRKIRILPRARQQVISGRLAFPAAVGHARPDRVSGSAPFFGSCPKSVITFQPVAAAGRNSGRRPR